MENTFLQLFLKTNLFDIDDNDDRLKNLEDAIADLKANFEEDISLIPRYTLVALDPNINEDEPTLKEVEQILIQHWKTLRSKYKKMPRNILRGVILNSLYNEGRSNANSARVIYFTALNYYPFSKLGNEKNLVEKMINDLGDLAEKDAIKEWALEEETPLKIGPLKINEFNFSKINIDSTDLQTSLIAACKRTPEGYNSYQHPDQWGSSFGSQASEAIVNLLEISFSQLSKSLNPSSIETPLNAFFSNFKKALDVSISTTFSSLNAIERRSKLLWWKEALYSSSQNKSYRDIDKNLLPLILTYDYYLELPVVTPISADYLLRDVVYLLNEKKNEVITFLDFFKNISSEENKIISKKFYNKLNETLGRISITDFITLLVNDKISISEFYNKTGIKENEEVSYSDLSVIILHDLLTQYITTN